MNGFRIERDVIGALILNPQLIEQQGDRLSPRLFGDSTNRDCFIRLRDQYSEGLSADAMGDLRFDLEAVARGDHALLMNLLDAQTDCPSWYGIYENLDALIEMALRRNSGKAAREFVEKVMNGAPVAQTLQEAQEALSLLQDQAMGDIEPVEANPLDVAANHDLKLGWIDDFADLMVEMTASPRVFFILIGLILVATVLQGRAVLRMAWGDIKANLYGTLLAASSVFHKSSALAKPRVLLARAKLDHLLLSELMTPEGLLRQLAEKPAGVIIRDEVGTLFDSHRTRYLQNLIPDLTAIFDNQPYSRRLSNEEITVKSPYLNILGATTPARLFEGLTYTHLHDGWLARWLIAWVDEEPNFDAQIGILSASQDKRMGELAARLAQLDKMIVTDFRLEECAFSLWNDWQSAGRKEAFQYGDDVIAAIVARHNTYALKFAIILSAVNGEWGQIDADTMQTACNLADFFKANMFKLLSQKANFGLSGAKLQKVFRAIKRSGDIGIKPREISRQTHLNNGELSPCLEKLMEIGAIERIDIGRFEIYRAIADKLPIKSW